VTFLDSLILGIVQGLSEFFPISSSFHLKIAKFFLGINHSPSAVFFDLICHAGTLLSAIFFLRKQIYNLFFKETKKLFLLFLAIVPLIPFYFLLKPVREYFSQIYFSGIFLLFTSFFLFFISFYPKKEKTYSSLNPKIKDVLFIGTMQAFALIPGISRSGSTISAACLRGWHIQEAIVFSFLLAIPTIIGGSVIESYKFFIEQPIGYQSINLSSYFGGFITSFVMGFVSIRYIFSVKDRKKMRPFAWYCLFLAFASILYFN
jgi:undecaprenyl-diphosphatase